MKFIRKKPKPKHTPIMAMSAIAEANINYLESQLSLEQFYMTECFTLANTICARMGLKGYSIQVECFGYVASCNIKYMDRSYRFLIGFKDWEHGFSWHHNKDYEMELYLDISEQLLGKESIPPRYFLGYDISKP